MGTFEKHASARTLPGQVLMLSAETHADLERANTNLVNHLKRYPDLNLADIAYTLRVQRKSAEYRRIVLCQTVQEAVIALESLDPKRVFTTQVKQQKRPIVFLFPGQGAQYIEMGYELYLHEPVFREQVDHCAEFLSAQLGLDLRTLLYPKERKEEAVELLKSSAFGLPALFVTEYALARLWMNWGVRPWAMIGYSLGEYVAACLAGVFSLEDALKLVTIRGRLMQTLPEGAMLAVSLSEEAVRPYLTQDISLAAVNGPSFCVVSGSAEAIKGLYQHLIEQNRECLPLEVDVAAHSVHMDPILKPFVETVEGFSLHVPSLPYISNVTGTWMNEREATNPEYWGRHIRQTVRFNEGLHELLQEEALVCLEMGPGQTLSSLIKVHPDKTARQAVFPSLRHPHKQIADSEFLLQTVGKLWLAGVEEACVALDRYGDHCSFNLSVYPSQDQPYLAKSQQVEQHSRPVAFLFPGLGDHYIDMALQLYQVEPTFRASVDLCSDILTPLLGLDLRSVLYPAGTHRKLVDLPLLGASDRKLDLRKMMRGSEERGNETAQLLNHTSFAQPALFVIEYALANVWIMWGVQPHALIGYSLGEYVAACIAGVISLEDALTLVAGRAQLIESLPEGAMLAVSLSANEIQPMLDQPISLAAINGPSQCIVAGPLKAIGSLEQKLTDHEIIFQRLRTSHAFHSRMMEPIVEAFIALVKTFHFRAPAIPYISNVTGTWITEAEVKDPTYWARHLCLPVRFADGIQCLWEDPWKVLLEVGPGQMLGHLAFQQLGGEENVPRAAFATLRSSYDQQMDMAFILKTVGRLWLEGVSINWKVLQAVEHYRFPTLMQRANASFSGQQEPIASQPLRPHSNLYATYVAPRNEIERTIAVLWQKVLTIEQIGVYDSFFDVGGHSLLALRMLALIKEAFHVDISLSVIFEKNTIAELALVIDAMLTVYVQPAQEQKKSSEALAVFTPLHRENTNSFHTPAVQFYTLPNGMVIAHQTKAETDHFYRDIFEHESYMRHNITLHDGACVFDVGANIGLFTLYIHILHANVKIYAFEPADVIYTILQNNVDAYHVQAKLFKCGLSNEAGEATFTFYPHSSGMSSFHADRAEEEEVLRTILNNQARNGPSEITQIVEHAQSLLKERLRSQTLLCPLKTLSSIIEEEDIQNIDLLKIDAQKSELNILEGIQEKDWPRISQIVMEVHDKDERLTHIMHLLKSHDYEVEVEQDELYKGSIMYNVYAIKRVK